MMIVGITSVAAISMGTSNCLAMRSLHAWDQGDRTNIDEALSHAMSDADLEHVIGQCLLRHRVYSEGQNGIVALSEPWKNVVATFYHELCEARRNPDVEDVIRSGNEKQLGWYSNKGGEIGDIPMSLAGAHLGARHGGGASRQGRDPSGPARMVEPCPRAGGPEPPPALTVSALPQAAGGLTA
jgi:hypothetical protein